MFGGTRWKQTVELLLEVNGGGHSDQKNGGSESNLCGANTMSWMEDLREAGENDGPDEGNLRALHSHTSLIYAT